MVMSVANQKGGVGKTTSALNIALYISESGFNTLLIDLDPQANATSGIGMDLTKIRHSIYDVMSGDEAVCDCIYPTPFDRLHLLPSNAQLSGADVELSTMVSRETILKQRLAPIRHSYDVILIDCPPSLSLLTLNAFSFTDQLIIPLQCEYFALEGLAKLLNTVDLVNQRINPSLNILGIVLTMFDSRTSLNRQVALNARSHFKDVIFNTVIPRNIRLAEAPSFGLPIALYAPSSSGSIAYHHLTKEVLHRAKLA